jgi:hypothetical protein
VQVRRKLAAPLDLDLPAYAFITAFRELRSIDARIRVIDEVARAEAEQTGDDDGQDVDPDDETFDPSNL